MTKNSPVRAEGKIALVVVGMHRSGTSAMARLLALNGGALPRNLMQGAPDNPTGFWESVDVALLNDQILAAHDSSWDDVFSGTPQPFAGAVDANLRQRAVDLIGEQFAGAPLVVLKDPRVTILGRFWHEALIAADYDPRYVVMVRHPLEVAGSLTSRDGFSREKALLLWSSYMIAAERDTRESPRVFVHYNDLLDDWRGTLDRIEGQLAVGLPRRNGAASLEADRFLQTSMRHHVRTDLAGLDSTWGPIKTLYNWALAAATDAPLPNFGPSQADEDLTGLRRVFGPILAEANDKIAGLQADLARLGVVANDQRVGQDLALNQVQRQVEISRGMELALGHLKQQIVQDRLVIESAQAERALMAGQITQLAAIIEALEQRSQAQAGALEDQLAQLGAERAERLGAQDRLEQQAHLLEEQVHLLEQERLGHSARAAELIAKEQELSAKEEALLALQQSHLDLAQRYGAITASTSWRITAPLRRWLGQRRGLAQRLRGGLRAAYYLVKFRIPNRPIAPAGLVAARAASRADAPSEPDTDGGPRHAAQTRQSAWPHGWPLAQTPNLSAAVLDQYDVRADDAIVRTCEAGRQFFARFALMSPEPLFAEAAAYVGRKTLAKTDDAAPDVSIIVPVYGQLAYTLNCLDALIGHVSRYSFEILVGDDASPDDSQQHLSQIGAIGYVRHPQNLGFIRNCNLVAEQAKGRFIVMLNNDTRVGEGWLDELIASFERFPKAGLVGSKLFYPDASLQEAGGIVWQDGSAWNYGRHDDPNRPAYTYARQVDYVSGAAIALPRTLWQSLGGFDEIYAPAYYEDTDLAFKVRQHGLEVWMQPLSRVVHYEGITSGTDLASGAKAYQLVNQDTFLQRWSQTLAAHRPNGQEPLRERERQVERRVLIIDVTAPTPNQDAGSVVVLQIIAVFQALGYKVTYLPLDNWLYQPDYLDDLRRGGVECVYAPFELDLDAYLAKEGHLFDVAHVFRFQVLRTALPAIKKHMPRARLIFNNQDLHYLRVMRQAEIENSAELRLQARAIKAAEIKAMNGADIVCTLSSAEKTVLDEEPTLKRPVAVVPYMITIPAQTPGFGLPRRDILFLGGYGHSPNIDAAHWLAKEIWPLVRPHLDGARLVLAGANPTPDVLALRADDIDVPGRVDDLEPLFAGARVFAAPLRYGAGVKGKLYSAFAHGVPVVTTSVGAEGMGLTPGEQAIIADDAQAFADALIELASNADIWTRTTQSAKSFVTTHHTIASGAQVMDQLLRLEI